MDEKSWDECVRFHGHSCPGLAIGYAAVLAAIDRLGIPLERAVDEEIVCVSENDACGVDCIQCLLSCTVGKGNLLFRQTGKGAYSFFARKSGKRIRLVTEFPSEWERLDKEELVVRILNAPPDKIFKFKEPDFELPESARIFENVRCEICGERAREDKIRLQEGRKVCLACFRDYSRSFL